MTARRSTCSWFPAAGATRREMKNDRLIAWIAERGRQVDDADLGLHGIAALGQSRAAGRQAGDDALAGLGGDARMVPGCQRDRRSARRRGGRRDHVGGDLGGHRHGAAGGRPASRRGGGSGDRQVHGVPFPGGQPEAGLIRKDLHTVPVGAGRSIASILALSR